MPFNYSLDEAVVSSWLVIYTAPRHEKRVAQHFVLRDIQHFLPLYRVQRRWRDGSTVTLNLPLFPGYIFVRADRSERARVLQVPGALSMIAGMGREPATLSDAEISTLQRGLALHHAEPHPLLAVGQRVRIRSGALAGREGVLVRNKSGFRVVLTLDLIMQSVVVEVDGDHLEPLESDSLAS